MILQNVLFTDQTGADKELYFRTSGAIHCNEKEASVPEGGVLSTDTYMNLFDRTIWGKYGNPGRIFLEIEVEGSGTIEILRWPEKRIVATLEFDELVFTQKRISVTEKMGMYCFRVRSSGCRLRNAAWVSLEQPVRPVCLALIICTYQRKEELKRNMEVIKRSPFFDEKSDLFEKLRVYVADNASEWPILKGSIQIFHNPNTGGSGGFRRGLEECLKEREKYGITHVIFMDDDVLVQEETFIRLYSMLSLLREEYISSVVGGRMFCLDRKEIQSTASEIWNSGNIIHIGENQDMRLEENLKEMNEKSGEYTGWWFGCFPIEFARENLPLPFFLHCDDVEYGLRCGKKPIILNGIQVWHETAANRRIPTIIYYDIKNAMIVNCMYCSSISHWKIIIGWMKTMWTYHFHGNVNEEYAAVEAMRDFLKGQRGFFRMSEKKFLNPKFFSRTKVGLLVQIGILLVQSIVRGRKAVRSFYELDPKKYSRDIIRNRVQEE